MPEDDSREMENGGATEHIDIVPGPGAFAGEPLPENPVAVTGDDFPAINEDVPKIAGETLRGDADEDGSDTAPFEDHREKKTDGEEEEESGEDGSEDNSEEDEDNGGATPLPLISVVEAVLFAAREPLKLAHIARAVGKGTRQEAVKTAIDELNVHYLETSRAFEIAEISERYQLMSRPEFVNHIMRIYPKRELAEKERNNRLTPAALDTLSIIAYKQPVTRGEIEYIRGVGCGPVLRALIERGSVKAAGKRADLVGQPLMYGTTEAFLAEFGLGSLDELPLRSEFLGMLGEAQPPVVVEKAPIEPDVSSTETENSAFGAEAAGDDEPSTTDNG